MKAGVPFVLPRCASDGYKIYLESFGLDSMCKRSRFVMFTTLTAEHASTRGYEVNLVLIQAYDDGAGDDSRQLER